MWVGGEKSLLYDPGSELRLGGREKKKGADDNKDGKKKREKKQVVASQLYLRFVLRNGWNPRSKVGPPKHFRAIAEESRPTCKHEQKERITWN